MASISFLSLYMWPYRAVHLLYIENDSESGRIEPINGTVESMVQLTWRCALSYKRTSGTSSWILVNLPVEDLAAFYMLLFALPGCSVVRTLFFYVVYILHFLLLWIPPRTAFFCLPPVHLPPYIAFCRCRSAVAVHAPCVHALLSYMFVVAVLPFACALPFCRCRAVHAAPFFSFLYIFVATFYSYIFLFLLLFFSSLPFATTPTVHFSSCHPFCQSASRVQPAEYSRVQPMEVQPDLTYIAGIVVDRRMIRINFDFASFAATFAVDHLHPPSLPADDHIINLRHLHGCMNMLYIYRHILLTWCWRVGVDVHVIYVIYAPHILWVNFRKIDASPCTSFVHLL